MKGHRLAHIDGLRGLAALAVVAQHTAERIIVRDPNHSDYLHFIFVDSFNAGRFGIALFFLISGFVVPFSFKEPNGLVNFLISRFFRLYPAYWLSIALAVPILSWYAGASFPVRTIVANVTMFQTALGEPGILGPYWTLIIELTFYGLCFLLYASGRLSNLPTLWAAFVLFIGLSLILSLYGAAYDRYVSANLPLNLSLMFFGTILRQLALSGDQCVRKNVRRSLPFLFLAIALILFSAPSRAPQFYTPFGFFTAYCIGIALFYRMKEARAFDYFQLRRIGVVSYSLYLLHDIVLSILERAFPFYGVGTHALFAFASFALSLVAAAAAYRAVERPAIDWGRRISHKLSPWIGQKILPRGT